MKNLKCKVLALCMGASVFMCGKAFSQVPSYVPTNGLVGYWPFNGNANDESGNGNNGTVNGATLTTDRFGNANKAYSFDGVSNFIDLSSSNFGITGNTERTISAWVNTNDQNYKAIFSSGSGVSGNPCSNNGNTFNMKLGNARLSLMTYNCGTCPSCDFYPQTGFYVSDNNWHFLVVKLKADTAFTYVDGTLDNINYMPNINTLGNSNYVGKDNHIGFEDWLQGLIDDIGLWNRALTSQEISDLYNATNCANDLTITPILNSLQTGNTANFTATTSDANSTFTWQSDFGQGFQTLNDFGNYFGTNTNVLSISNVQLANHNQPIRAISSNTNCTDTSNVATIQIADTCITTVYDTLLTTVTDTLIINTTLGLPAPNNENTILIYPNPASDHITIDNGNYTAMAGYTIKIENNAGQQVFQSLINQAQFYVDLSTWSGNGLYFVHLIDAQGNTVTVRKIVLQ